MAYRLTFAVALVTSLIVSEGVFAQHQSTTIRGHVVSADGQPAAAVRVTLLDQLGSPLTATTTDPDGRFHLDEVRPGTYTLFADAPPQSDARKITVRDALPLDVQLTLSARAAESVVVLGSAPSAGASITISSETLRQLPSRLSSRSLQQWLATLPGWASEDNGLLHVRGVDDGFLFVEDGVPVYDRIDALFGIARDAADIGSVNVLTGYIPPQFGLKSGAVVEVQSAQPPSDGLAASAEATIGTDSASALRASGRAARGSAAFGASLSGERSDRFLDPVHPDSFHNDGSVFSAAANASGLIHGDHFTRVAVAAGGSRHEVPHGDMQEEAGQDQRQRLRQLSVSGSWQRAWSDTLVSQAALYGREIDATLQGSLADSPLRADSDRRHRRLGVLAGVTYARGKHTVKAGFESARLDLDEDFSFAVTGPDAEGAELSERAAQFTMANPFRFRGSASRGQWAFYAQDSVRAADRLTVDFGLRWDRSNLLVPASQWSPRAGAALNWPGRSTTLRASVNRFFQPPQAEHLLLSSSAEARALSPFAEDDDNDGGADLLPERQTAIEAGVEHWFGGIVRVDAAFWSRHVRNYGDPNVFFGTTIIFPNSVASGTARGIDLRVDIARYRGWSSYASYTLSKVEQVGPINGGLFLESDIIEIGPGTRFTPDHDQRHAGGAGVTYQNGSGRFSLSLAARHESGTPIEVDAGDHDELMERPGAERVDFAVGRVRPRTVFDVSLAQRLHRGRQIETTLRVAVLNVTDHAYALNFGNPFSGTHFGAPRTLRVDVRISRD